MRRTLGATGCFGLVCFGFLLAACGDGDKESTAATHEEGSGGAPSDIELGSGGDPSDQSSGGTTSAGSGGVGTGGEPPSGSGGTSGSGGAPSNDRCSQIVTVTSDNLIIDDFEHGASPTLPAPLNGVWRHNSSADGASRAVDFIEDTGMEGAGSTVARIACQAGDAEEDAACNEPVYDALPFAFLVTALVETGECLDASFATGITFRARSESGMETLQLVVTNPATRLMQPAESYSEQFTVTESWKTFTVDFDAVTHSSEGDPDDGEDPSFTPTELTNIGFIIRGVRGMDSEPGYLEPYALLIDDVSFY